METLSYCQLMERMLAAEARVVELESRTVKMPQRHCVVLRKDFNEYYHTEMTYKADEIQAALVAADIKWVNK